MFLYIHYKSLKRLLYALRGCEGVDSSWGLTSRQSRVPRCCPSALTRDGKPSALDTHLRAPKHCVCEKTRVKMFIAATHTSQANKDHSSSTGKEETDTTLNNRVLEWCHQFRNGGVPHTRENTDACTKHHVTLKRLAAGASYRVAPFAQGTEQAALQR